jgi:hypothetical protein
METPKQAGRAGQLSQSAQVCSRSAKLLPTSLNEGCTVARTTFRSFTRNLEVTDLRWMPTEGF